LHERERLEVIEPACHRSGGQIGERDLLDGDLLALS
jgi:hypothetical protein